MKKICIIFILVLCASSIFAFNLNTFYGIESSIQKWYMLTTNTSMSTNDVFNMAITIIYVSKFFNIQIPIIMGIIAVESSFIPTASNGISIGLMQVQPNTFTFVKKHFNIKNGKLNNITYNIIIGVGYLKYLKSLGLTNKQMIEDYNGGANKVKYYYMVEHAINKMKSW